MNAVVKLRRKICGRMFTVMGKMREMQESERSVAHVGI